MDKLKWLTIILGLFFLLGCSSLFPSMPTHSTNPLGKAMEVVGSNSTNELSMLSWVGGLATIVGIAALVITRGTLGMRAIVIGVCLVILNFAIANYLSWVMIPALVGTGCVSLAWAYVTVRDVLKIGKEVKDLENV
jgi:hypothetical protein